MTTNLKSLGVVRTWAASYIFKCHDTEPEAANVPAVRSADISSVLNWIKLLANSVDPEDAWPYMANIVVKDNLKVWFLNLLGMH